MMIGAQFRPGEIAVEIKYDGRTIATEKTVRVLRHNEQHDEYLVSDRHARWRIVSAKDLLKFPAANRSEDDVHDYRVPVF